jgi:hypothetical protein
MELAEDVLDRFCCLPLYGVQMIHENEREDFLFSIFRIVSQANTEVLPAVKHYQSKGSSWEPGPPQR